LEEKSPFSDLHPLLWKKRKQRHPSHGNTDGGPKQRLLPFLSRPAQGTSGQRTIGISTLRIRKKRKRKRTNREIATYVINLLNYVCQINDFPGKVPRDTVFYFALASTTQD